MSDAEIADAPSARRGAYAKGVRRRQEILDRAIEVFAERGASGTSLRAIGETIGVSHAALRHYFASREELLVEVYRSAEDLSRSAEEALEQNSVVEGMIEAARTNRTVPGLVQLYSSLVASAVEAGDSTTRGFITERFELVRDFLTDIIRTRQAEGKMRPDLPPRDVAALVIAASDGLQIQWLLDDSVSVERSLQVLDRLLVDPPDATSPDGDRRSD